MGCLQCGLLGFTARTFHHELLDPYGRSRSTDGRGSALDFCSSPVRVFMHAYRSGLFVSGWPGFLRWSPVQRLGRAFGHPMLLDCRYSRPHRMACSGCVRIGYAVDGWHEVEYACFFGAGLLFWWPVVQPWPNVARGRGVSIVLYLSLPHAVRCAFRVSYLLRPRCISSYLSGNRHFGILPLQDQEYAAP